MDAVFFEVLFSSPPTAVSVWINRCGWHFDSVSVSNMLFGYVSQSQYAKVEQVEGNVIIIDAQKNHHGFDCSTERKKNRSDKRRHS